MHFLVGHPVASSFSVPKRLIHGKNWTFKTTFFKDNNEHLTEICEPQTPLVFMQRNVVGEEIETHLHKK